MKLKLKEGTTSKIVTVFIQDSSSTTGAGLTGLLFNTASLTGYWIAEGDATATQITMATMTIGTWATGGFIEVDATNLPGVYQVGIPDVVIDNTSEGSVVVMYKGATNMAPCVLEIELDAIDYRGGVVPTVTTLSNLPSIPANWLTAAGAAADFGTEIRDLITGFAGSLDTDANGRIRIVDGTAAGELDTSAGLVQLLAATQASIDAIEVDTNSLNDTKIPDTISLAAINAEADTAITDAALATAAALATVQADTDDIQLRLPAALTKGTADSGTTLTMVDAARTEADTDYFVGSWIRFTSGTITDQTRLITGFNFTTNTITFAPATTQAVGTNTYEIIPAADIRLVDTLTTYTGNTVQTGDNFARIGAPVGASISADLADVPTVSEFNARTILQADYFDPAVDAVATVTNLTNLPTIPANWLTAAGTAADFGVEIRDLITGGAYALDTDANGRIRVVDGVAAGELDTASGLVQLLAATQASIDAIEVDTNSLNDTKIPDTISLAAMNAQMDTALSDIHLDHLLAVDYDPAAKPGVATALLNELIESNAGVSRYTAASLIQAPTGAGGDGSGFTSIPWNAAWDAEVESEATDALVAMFTSSAQLVDDVWDELMAGHVTPDSAGLVLNDLQDGGRLDLLIDQILDDTGTTGVKVAAGAIAAAAFAANAIDAASFATDTVNEIRDAITGFSGALDTDANGAVRVVDGTGAREIDTLSGSIVQVDQLGAQAKLDVNAEVLDVVNVDVISEPSQAIPPVTPTIKQALAYIYNPVVQKITQTASKIAAYNNAGTEIWSKVSSDDATTYQETNAVSGV